MISFSSRYGHPRDLHSFPTRRSSDLDVAPVGRPRGHEFARVCVGQAPGPTQTRSEEHTSELQSLTNLVCRLLLEKKKDSRHHATIPIESIKKHVTRRLGLSEPCNAAD